MTKLKKIIFFLCAILFCALAHAQSASAALTHLLLNTHTMQADFTQIIKYDKASVMHQSQGRMALERPGKFRWEIVKPNNQLIIANGSRLWIYDPDLEQVTIRSFSKAAGQTPALLLSDSNLTLEKDFSIKQVAGASQIAGTEVFRLTPKDKENLFVSITLTFIQKQIREMQLADHLGHVTVVAFKNVKLGLTLPATLFTFTPPPQVDVIDETKKRK